MQVVELPGHDGRTGLWTRHSVGALEAERDLRRQHRAARTVVYRAVPRTAEVLVVADFAADRWADEGGSFDRELATAAVSS